MDSATIERTWLRACVARDVPENGGVCIKYKSHQIALFYFAHRNEWFATQNMCPHRQQMALSRGLLGSHGNEPKVACPFHKTTFSLVDGRCLNHEEEYRLATYPVAEVGGVIYINVSSLDDVAAHTDKTSVHEKSNT